MTIDTEIIINGRTVSKGTELSIRGARGRFRFVKQVTKDDGTSWLDVWGGPKGHETLRSFRAEQVRTVHRIAVTPVNLARARGKA